MNQLPGLTGSSNVARARGLALPLALGAAALCAASPEAASAQVSAQSSPGVSQTLSGPRRIGIRLNVIGTHETNAVHLSKSEAAARGVRLKDNSVTPSATFDILQPIGRGAAFLTGEAGYSFFQHNSYLNRENSNLRGGYGLNTAGCRATVTGAHSRSRNDLQDPTLTDLKATTAETTAQFDAVCGERLTIAPTVSVTQSWQNNSGANSSNDSRTFGWSAGAIYQGLAEGGLSAAVLSQKTTFPNRKVLGSTASGDYKLYGATVTYQRGIGSRLKGAVSVGYTVVDSDTSGKFKTNTLNGALSYKVGSRLGLDGEFSRRVVPSNQIGGSYRLEQRFDLTSGYRLSDRLALRAGGAREKGREHGSIIVPAGGPLSYRSTSLFGGGTLTLRRFALALNVENEDRNSSERRLSYTDLKTSLTLSTAF